MKKKNWFTILVCLMSWPPGIFAQNALPAQSPVQAPVYPKIGAYACVVLPIVSTSSETTTWNFSNTFSIGLASGINILYSDKFGFSFDLTPIITTTKGTSTVSKIIFDPGPIFRFKHGVALITRIAFETAGRFGESTVVSKVFKTGTSTSTIVALGIPVRFGNNLPPSIGATLFFGVGF